MPAGPNQTASHSRAREAIEQDIAFLARAVYRLTSGQGEAARWSTEDQARLREIAERDAPDGSLQPWEQPSHKPGDDHDDLSHPARMP